ncbi:C6 transcription factor [Aspergillus bombycis]|uniref:C6 transcription factor n=1 Tax=Aspergillus bombycis TaxID=109264 RepID=A0A1F7ZZB3_9EURO|nr:C6 transcription factor [Aspergillus bombycis]OGM44435.1 C6 transcription factor [Aspergillus bombycis]
MSTQHGYRPVANGTQIVVYEYQPNKAAGLVFVALFGAVTVAYIGYSLISLRTWHFISFLLGGICTLRRSSGYYGRAASASDAARTGPFVLQTILLLVVAPLLAATIYMTAGRTHCAGQATSLLACRRGRFHILSCGYVHDRLRLAGLAVTVTHPWERVFVAIEIATVLLLVRSVVREFEYLQGSGRFVVSHEIFLYVFDAMLMWIMMALLLVFHSRRVVQKMGRLKDDNCDEVHPACGQCTSHDVDCDFTIPQSAPSEITSTGSIRTPGVELTTPSSHHSIVFISSSKTDFKLPKRRYQRRPTTTKETAKVAVPPTPTKTTFPLNTTDLELFHHYLSVTSPTLADDDAGMHALQVAVPELGFRFHYILHLALAFASYHMARLPGMGAPHGRILEGDRHYNTALTQVSASIAGLNESTCHAVYGSAVLICLCSLAKGPREGEYLAFGDSDCAEWLTLLRGIRSITEVSRDLFYIDPVSSPSSETRERLLHGNPRICHEHSWPEWKVRLKECERLIETEYYTAGDGIQPAVYVHVLTCLTNAFHYVYRKIDVGRGERCAKTFQWLYQLPEAFVFDLQQRKWPALLLLSHFLVLLQQLNSYWFVEGWPEHVMGEIYRSFNAQQRVWLQWPAGQIGWCPPTTADDA